MPRDAEFRKLIRRVLDSCAAAGRVRKLELALKCAEGDGKRTDVG